MGSCQEPRAVQWTQPMQAAKRETLQYCEYLHNGSHIWAVTLTCEKCYGSADTCQPAKDTCTVTKGTGGCISGVRESTLGETPSTVFYKECIDVYNSGIKSPLTFTGGAGKYVRINTTRCNDTDNCNSAVLAVPTENATKNGLQCPTCFDLKSNICNGPIALCTGDETYCIDFTGTILNGSSPSPFAAKGCATASAQDIKPGTFLASGPFIYLFSRATYVPAEKTPTTPSSPTNATLLKTTRSGASPALGKFSFALYLPGLTGLLLVKLLS
ncbi:phospholipase A2 inhibitor and Ly6/PLAUR domain-containing protein-like [Trachemys scripta elegans]|uniref:phospholipase A2 inhibitor and Ly6/PLAUR domain-containing protein-like n=1 Tax=Trachemys scripta elegans TaxID=31138 RepID=UPI001555A136|nr:phospholipase A2 inhibitor and Ly6/PLAUR domain-containing protein-like [Trachemys scripta elegans]